MSASEGERESHPHSFFKVDGVWLCECGTQHDRFGMEIQARHLKLVK